MKFTTRRESGGNLLPERLLQFAIAGDEAIPKYLTCADHPWLRTLMEEYQRFDGSRLTDLRERLREPLPCYAPDGKLKLAVHVLDRLCRNRRPAAPVPPKEARKILFTEAQRARLQSLQSRTYDRDPIVAAVASKLGVSPPALLASLFADLPAERLVALPSPLPDPGDLALRANLALAQGFLQRASRITLELEGNARAVVRQILHRRLLCTVRPRSRPRTASLEISGPYSLFKRTLLYGRAIASVVSALHASHHFRLSAETILRERELIVTLRSGDPIFPDAGAYKQYDSRLEERFACEFRRAARDWDLLREPEPLQAGDHMIFPDFAIQHRRDPKRRVLLEIVGFWTPQYLRRKLEHLREAGASNLILCIDDKLSCADGALPQAGPVIRFHRRIDVAVVLAKVEEIQPSGGSRR